LNRERKQLIQDLAMLEQERDRYEQELNALQPADVAVLSEEKLTEDIDPGYSERMEALRSNTELSSVERLDQEQRMDQELISKLDRALESIDQKLKSNPQDKELQQRRQTVLNIKEDTELTVIQRSNELQSLEKEENVTRLTQTELIN
ncbi:MAG: hypothetical protein ACK45H_00215, partial [Bacteroidota bacterium]